MICPNCGVENRETARFCQRCGQLMVMGEPSSAENGRASGQSVAADDTLPVTRPLAEARGGFAPLPVGALLLQDRFAVTEVRAVSLSNLYQVEDALAVRPCPTCRTLITDPDEQFCSSCGAELVNVMPLHLRYLLHESADEQAFATEARLLEMQLSHPGLLLPLQVFSDTPYGPSRRYLLEHEAAPQPASKLSLPQEINQVLEWGVSLAWALDELHRHGVVLREISLDHIGVGEGMARWVLCPGLAHMITAASAAEMTSHIAQNVRGLAMALFHLATGSPDFSAGATLPDRVQELFAQVLAAPQRLDHAASFATALETVLQELLHPTGVSVVFGSRTHVGQVRNLNEDGLLTLFVNPVLRSVTNPLGLFVVADGMGGHEAGDVASQLTIRTIARLALDEVMAPAAAGADIPPPKDWLAAAAGAANRLVYERRRAAGTDMGTTLVMALLVGDVATILNVGDSRAYLLKANGIARITTDHSLVERLVATGQITPEEAVTHPQKNVIYRVIGDKSHVEVDLFEQRLAPREALLLCSDGLSGMIDDQQIEHIWRISTSPQDACDQLVEAANEAGGEDNITVVIVQVV